MKNDVCPAFLTASMSSLKKVSFCADGDWQNSTGKGLITPLKWIQRGNPKRLLSCLLDSSKGQTSVLGKIKASNMQQVFYNFGSLCKTLLAKKQPVEKCSIQFSQVVSMSQLVVSQLVSILSISQLVSSLVSQLVSELVSQLVSQLVCQIVTKFVPELVQLVQSVS